MSSIKNLKFKDGVTCPIFIKNLMDIVNETTRVPQPTYGTRKLGTCPYTGVEVVQEFNGINNGEEDWLCLHNENPEDDAVDVAAFKKRTNDNRGTSLGAI